MLIKTPIGVLNIKCSDKGLCSISGKSLSGKPFHEKNDPEMSELLQRENPSEDLFEIVDDGNKTLSPAEVLERRVAEWVAKYFVGAEREFPKDIPLDLNGTEFQTAVWEELMKIPYGETKTYGEIAKKMGKPMSARAVGSACGKNRVLLAVPCHRVVGTSGLGGFALGLEKKRLLLDLEGSLNE